MKYISCLLFCLFGLVGCAHSYYYSPEIVGEAAMHGSKGGIIYTIPAKETPELVMRVRSLGVKKKGTTQMLGMRLSFVRPEGFMKRAGMFREFLDPKEQTIRLGIGGKEIKPVYVHSKSKDDALVDLTDSKHEVVELLYPLVNEQNGASDFARFYFQWKLHYGQNQVEQQIARFDRHDAAPQQAEVVFPEDNDYPYDVSPMDMPGWTIVRDPYWWGIDPFWPL